MDSFPATHLKKMDAFDFIFKFSSELLVLSAVALAIITNLYFFAGSQAKTFSDNSLSAQFLNNHIALNRALYSRNNSIVTRISGNSFVPTALAEADFSGLDALQEADQSAVPDSASVQMDEDNNSFVQPTADSVSALIAKQVKIYETKPGDTLKSISAAYNISQQTIIWANNLPNTTIKPGWYLKILPTDGILYTADSNDTLPDIAHAFSPERYNSDKQARENAAGHLLDKIISYNLLDSPEDVNPGDILIIPGGVIAAPPQPKPAPKPKTSSGKTQSVTQAARSSFDTTGHIFPWGYCTWYVAKWMHDNKGYDIPWGGNAKNWLVNAQTYGAVVSKTPAAGTIAVTTENKRYGHVVVVEKVEGDKILISEMNYKGKGITSQRWLDADSPVIRGFIYK